MTAFSNFSRPTEVSFSRFLVYYSSETHPFAFFVFKILDIQGSNPENTSAAFQARKCSSNCQKWSKMASTLLREEL